MLLCIAASFQEISRSLLSLPPNFNRPPPPPPSSHVHRSARLEEFTGLLRSVSDTQKSCVKPFTGFLGFGFGSN